MIQRSYKACFYNVVSFVLFLIALTYPIEPHVNTSAMYNLWFKLLFDVLPIDLPFETILKELHYDSETRPFKSRREFVDLVFALHEKITGKPVDKDRFFAFFDQLRATECGHDESSENEPSCRLPERKLPNVCVVIVHSNPQTATEQDFMMDKSLWIEKKTQTDPMENKNAFCSCVFSAKWLLLHMIASEFPKDHPTEEERYKYHSFLTLFGKLLACFACRVNFEANLELVRYEPQTDLQSRHAFETLIYHLHKTVNAMLGKSEANISFEELDKLLHTFQTQTTEKHRCNLLVAQKKDVKKRFYFTK